MRRLLLVSGLLGVVASVGAACGRTGVFIVPQACVFDTDCDGGLHCVNQVCMVLEFVDGGARGGKRFGEPCDAGVECASSLCVGGPANAFCTELCDGADAGCPEAYDCKGQSLLLTATADGGGRDAGLLRRDVCAVAQPFLCQGCTGDLDCGASGSDRCLAMDGGRFCGRDCSFAGCPPLYACQATADGARQCVPTGKTCDCVPATEGMEKTCRGQANPFGACPGSQRCQPDGGFTACSAPLAAEEVCDGLDNDCDSAVDETMWAQCTRVSGMRTCRGPQLCRGATGLVCAAREPTTEVCNREDDDCDDVVDDGFVDGLGRYTSTPNCGNCGNDCSKIDHATSVVCDVSDAGVSATPRCKVLACDAGFFPYADGGFCMQLPDTLCRPCARDDDCVGPGSRCLFVDGAKVCGRDCGPGSPYGACPTGYTCSAQAGGGSQCLPVTNTCTCRASTLGSTRSCNIMAPVGLMTCGGFETCGDGGTGPTWSTCATSAANFERCDAVDNDCNGQIDEGFRNATTGKYDTVANCGFCNNDCTKYFSAALQHTTGVCNTAPATPTCVMGACLTEVVGGTTFEWVNVNALSADGCECRRVQGNLTVDLPDRLPGSGSAPSWVDENCDGIDGVATQAVFVSATASAGGTGTRAAPFQTIASGLQSLQATPSKRYVLVAQGLYRENVRLFDGAQLFGGYSSDFLKRDPKVHTTFIQGQAPSMTASAAVHVEGAGAGVAETVVAGFTILGWDAPGGTAVGQAGQASIAVFLRNVGAKVVLQTNDIFAGRGAPGGRGATGNQGFGRQASALVNGAAGLDSRFFASGNCGAGNHQNGGARGTNAQCAGADAERGGNVVCPQYTFGTNVGAPQEYVSPMAPSRNGRGGFDWSYSPLSGAGCSQVQESGYPSMIQAHDGLDGAQGPDGSGGQGGAGAGALARHGSLLAGQWVAAPSGANAGQAGSVGLGGGGGGAGGGVARFTAGGCQGWQIGATGGGGGAGACGGTGGAPGGAGGGSIAILLTSTAATAVVPVISNNRFQRGLGGDGGNGGFGGAGGLGGAGGFGGNSTVWSGSVGGKGGEGGNGGPGGGGGGGAGGPSFVLLGFNVPVASFGAVNQVLTSAMVNTGGEGGLGGSSPGAVSSTGAAGTKGASADYVALQACGGGCPGGTTCDANGVCAPN